MNLGGRYATTRSLEINKTEENTEVSLSKSEFGRDSVQIGYCLDEEETLDFTRALLQSTGKNYEVVEVPDSHVPYESGFSPEYFCGEGAEKVSVFYSGITPDTIRKRAANLLRIANVLESQETAEDERQNEVSEYLGWGPYTKLGTEEQKIIESIIEVDRMKKIDLKYN